MIEVDLIPNAGPDSGAIVAVAQADPNVWANLAAQAGQMAAQQGYSIQTGTLYSDSSPERTLTSVADVQNWLATVSNVGTAAPTGAAGGGMSGATIFALTVAGLSLATLAALAIRAATR